MPFSAYLRMIDDLDPVVREQVQSRFMAHLVYEGHGEVNIKESADERDWCMNRGPTVLTLMAVMQRSRRPR